MAWIGAGVLTLVALAVRIPGLSQSLFGDELFTYDTAAVGSLHDLVHAVRTTEVSPPLYFFVVWLARRVGDAQLWLRLPSLLCGVALIPVVYAVGRRLVGSTAALVGAGFATLSPFLVWYSNEARGYALLALLVVCSTWSLLVALERGGFWRWALLTVLVAAVLLTHYTGAFVVVAQAVWACWVRRERIRPIVISFVVSLLALAVWLPFAPGDNGAIAFLVKLTPSSIGREALRALAGQPYARVEDLPGTIAYVVLALAALACVAGAVAAVRSGRADRRLLLVALLAFVTPVGLIVYSLFQPNIYVGRNLISSLPYVYLLAGALLLALPRPVAIAGVALTTVGLGIGLVKSFEQRYQRPDWKGGGRLPGPLRGQRRPRGRARALPDPGRARPRAGQPAGAAGPAQAPDRDRRRPRGRPAPPGRGGRRAPGDVGGGPAGRRADLRPAAAEDRRRLRARGPEDVRRAGPDRALPVRAALS